MRKLQDVKATNTPRARVKGPTLTARDYVHAVFQTAEHSAPIPFAQVDGDSTEPDTGDSRAQWPEIAFDVRLIGRRTLTPAGIVPYAPYGYARRDEAEPRARRARRLTAKQSEARARALESIRARHAADTTREHAACDAARARRLASEPRTEDERKQARAELRAELRKAREQNSHTPGANPLIDGLRRRCWVSAGRLVDRASAAGKAYALPGDETKRAHALSLGRHRAKGCIGRKEWDYLRRELSEELFSCVLAHAAPSIVDEGETLEDGSRATAHDAAWSFHYATSAAWPVACHEADKLFQRMKHSDETRAGIEAVDTDPHEDTTPAPIRAHDLKGLSESLAAFYLARSPRNAETLLAADLRAVRALMAGEIRLDAKGKQFARFIRMAKRADEGARLIGRTRAPVRACDYQRKRGRKSVMTV
jgi:hypothetical protein